MRRGLRAAAIAATLLGLAIGPPSQAIARQLHFEAISKARRIEAVSTCQERHPWQRVGQRQTLIWCLAHRLGAPGSPRYAIAIARCESGSDFQDIYGGDGHVGTFQHITDSWPGRWRQWGRDLGVPDGQSNVWSQTVVSVRMARYDGTWAQQWACA